MSRKCGITRFDHLHGDVHSCPARIGLARRLSAGSGNGSLLSQYGMVRKVERRGQQVVQVRRAGARQARDHDRRQQLDVVNLRVTARAGR